MAFERFDFPPTTKLGVLRWVVLFTMFFNLLYLLNVAIAISIRNWYITQSFPFLWILLILNGYMIYMFVTEGGP